MIRALRIAMWMLIGALVVVVVGAVSNLMGPDDFLLDLTDVPVNAVSTPLKSPAKLLKNNACMALVRERSSVQS